MCGCKPKKSNTYCSRHKKYEGQAPKTKKIMPPPRRSIVSTKRTNKFKKHQDVILHKGPGGKLYHRPTSLVFGPDKVAIGTWLRADDNPAGVDDVIPLTDKDVETAKKYMFAFRRDKQDNLSDETSKVGRLLAPNVAKKLQKSLSQAIAATNSQAEDVADILCELQVRDSPSKLTEEEVSDESEYEEVLEEEED